MPNPQVHAAVGMMGILVVFFVVYGILSIFYDQKRIRKLLLLLPLIIIIGSMLSLFPDYSEMARDYPSVFNKFHVTKYDKAAWHTPFFNIFFFHPYLDSKFAEQYDTTGLILTLLVFNGISLFYLVRMRRYHED